MATVRTSITIDAELFKRAESAAKKLGISRSNLLAVAQREFLLQEENRLLLQRLNMVADRVPPDERAIPAAMKRRQREIVMSELRRRQDDASTDP